MVVEYACGDIFFFFFLPKSLHSFNSFSLSLSLSLLGVECRLDQVMMDYKRRLR